MTSVEIKLGNKIMTSVDLRFWFQLVTSVDFKLWYQVVASVDFSCQWPICFQAQASFSKLQFWREEMSVPKNHLWCLQIGGAPDTVACTVFLMESWAQPVN